MNACKLLPCGRIIFYNLSTVSSPSDFLPTQQAGNGGDFSADDSIEVEQFSKAVHMGSSHAAISDNSMKSTVRARRGSGGITSHGRNSIRAGCYWLEERFGKTNLTLLTTTLPDEAMRKCTPSTWAIVVNRFLKALRYHLEKAGLSPEIVGCTEIQEKRLLTTDGIPPLHLHLLFQGRKSYRHWAIEKQEFQRLWSQSCKSVWQLEVEFLSSCRAESVKTSGVSYMSKYLSKGGTVLSKCKPELLPSAWYTVSANVKEMIKRTTLRIGNHLARNLYESIQKSSILKWARDIWSCEHGDGSQYLVAWVGQIASREVYWKLQKELAFCVSVNTETQNASHVFNL